MHAQELRKKTCFFTGHRNIPSGKEKDLAVQTAREVYRLITEHDVQFFGVGGAVGYDTLVAKVLFRIRERAFPHIKVILVYPFDGFTSHWSPQQQADYAALLPKYDKIVCVCDKPSREAYLARNRHLVNASAYCIAYCTQRHGGTAYTVDYAKTQGVTIIGVGE